MDMCTVDTTHHHRPAGIQVDLLRPRHTGVERVHPLKEKRGREGEGEGAGG